jgi:hypothetical protein
MIPWSLLYVLIITVGAECESAWQDAAGLQKAGRDEAGRERGRKTRNPAEYAYIRSHSFGFLLEGSIQDGYWHKMFVFGDKRIEMAETGLSFCVTVRLLHHRHNLLQSCSKCHIYPV